jgi:hypothetical protein
MGHFDGCQWVVGPTPTQQIAAGAACLAPVPLGYFLDGPHASPMLTPYPMPTPCQPHAGPLAPCQPHASPVLTTPCGPMWHVAPCQPQPHATSCGPMPTPTPCDPMRRGFPPGPRTPDPDLWALGSGGGKRQAASGKWQWQVASSK